MGLLGPDVKEENGERFAVSYEGENKEIAYRVAEEARECGFKAHVKPVTRGDKIMFVTWVSEFQTRKVAPPGSQG